MQGFDLKYGEYLRYFEDSLSARLGSFNDSAPEKIKSAMEYSVSGGGKRVRPILCYSACEMLGGSLNEVREIALAIEFIHSYSLVHDDLPAMDNDDYRRGKFSTHKKFGEAIGILAGDALLNYAFETIFSANAFSDGYVKAAKLVAEYAGYSGMIGGQVLDLDNEKNENACEKDLYDIYLNKTAKLISAPILAASLICGGKFYKELKEFGYHLGILFQISDDIMDECGTLEKIGKTPHKDGAEDKLTAIKIFGLDGAKKIAEKHYLSAKTVINQIDKVGFLTEFTDKMYLRTS